MCSGELKWNRELDVGVDRRIILKRSKDLSGTVECTFIGFGIGVVVCILRKSVRTFGFN
jgi:hypothetical protein